MPRRPDAHAADLRRARRGEPVEVATHAEVVLLDGREPRNCRSLLPVAGERADRELTVARDRPRRTSRPSLSAARARGRAVADDRRRALSGGQTDHHAQRSRSPRTTRSTFSSGRSVAAYRSSSAIQLSHCARASSPSRSSPRPSRSSARRLDPDRVREEGTESCSGGGDAFQDQEAGRSRFRPAAVVTSPLGALEPRDAIPGQRYRRRSISSGHQSRGLSQLAKSSVCAISAPLSDEDMDGEAALAGPAEPVDRDHPRLHPIGRRRARTPSPTVSSIAARVSCSAATRPTVTAGRG